jgi:hypothetical protein
MANMHSLINLLPIMPEPVWRAWEALAQRRARQFPSA